MEGVRLKRISAVPALILATLVSSCTQSQRGPAPKASRLEMPQVVGWPVTEGSAGGGRYSPLTEIDRTNVSQLKVVWTYRHGDFRSGGLLPDKYFKGTAFEATPIVVGGRLIFTTPFNRVVALDPKTGAELWTFNPKIDTGRRFGNMMINRGVAYWLDPNAEGVCASRVFLGTLDARLIALDVKTGKPCTDFGKAGTVNLLEGIQHLVDSWEYNVTSPPTIVGDNVIVGSSIADITRRIMPSGAVRAYNARSGALVWRFNTIPQEGEYENETWERGSWRHNGAANVWSTMTADLERGLVFLPVSSAGPDLYGGDRPGANLFSDAVVALDAKTGELVWHFQTVHHDIWDYDLAAPPILVRVEHNGREIDAVVQLTKTGPVFVLDRETGTLLFPVEERPVPPSDVSGEMAWPTQPFPVKPPPLVPHHLTEDDLWDEDASHLEACKKKLRKLRNEGIFTPPSERGSLLYPGATGGSNWSGARWRPSISTSVISSGRCLLAKTRTAYAVCSTSVRRSLQLAGWSSTAELRTNASGTTTARRARYSQPSSSPPAYTPARSLTNWILMESSTWWSPREAIPSWARSSVITSSPTPCRTQLGEGGSCLHRVQGPAVPDDQGKRAGGRTGANQRRAQLV